MEHIGVTYIKYYQYYAQQRMGSNIRLAKLMICDYASVATAPSNPMFEAARTAYNDN